MFPLELFGIRECFVFAFVSPRILAFGASYYPTRVTNEVLLDYQFRYLVHINTPVFILLRSYHFCPLLALFSG
eukprot:3652619-Pyramimonas_sp.AAC.1